MLSQTGGTLGAIADLGNYTDADHYKMVEPAGARVVYNLLTLDGGARHHVLAFTSCRRFSGHFALSPGTIRVTLDLEGLTLGPGERWPLEEFSVSSGTDREALLDGVASRLAAHHKPLSFRAPPSGWCSWYCFGPKVTARQVLDNLDVIARDIPGLRYIQIDDGYQPAMGDWLETGTAFGGDGADRAAADSRPRLRAGHLGGAVHRRRRVHALQAAPRLVREGQHGRAAARGSCDVRRAGDAGPGMRSTARIPRRRRISSACSAPCATSGAARISSSTPISGARFTADDFTIRARLASRRIDAAWRRCCAARATRSCSAATIPIWPSIGVIHGSRSSHDIRRDWKRISDTARQNLSRNWQNGRLWWNDPDAIVLTGDLSDDEFRFHATAIFASGGMILSGDDLTTITPARLAMLRKLQPPTGRAARFADTAMHVGVVDLGDRQAHCLFNWSDDRRAPPDHAAALTAGARLLD